MTPEQAVEYKRANKSITIDYDGDRYISEYDIGRGFYRQDDTCEIPDTEREAIKNDALHSTTNVLKAELLNALIKRY
jgi:hypothetical protein